MTTKKGGTDSGRQTTKMTPDATACCHSTFGSDAHAGVGQGVGNVGEQVDGDVGEADGEDAALDQGVVAVGDGGEGEAADAGPGEDRLRNDGAGEQAAELQADDGENGDQGVGSAWR